MPLLFLLLTGLENEIESAVPDMSYRKFAYVYDELMEDMPYPDWIRFARTAWEKHGMPKSVAELGCGTGSITIPLVNSGFEVTGIDLSADMLSVARSKMEATPQVIACIARAVSVGCSRICGNGEFRNLWIR